MSDLSSLRMFLLLLVVLLLGVAFCVVVELTAIHTNGSPGFPLDDPWIHLQFARNLHDFGSFSYFKNEMVTSGSTSPLFTFLLAVGFFFTGNEFVLSYAIGILFLGVAGFFLYKVARHDQEWVLAAGAVLLMMFEPRLVWGALSGMETTMFIALLLGVAYFYKTRKSVPLGIASGLLLWARPEAVIFLGVLFVDVAYHAFAVRLPAVKKKDSKPNHVSLGWLKIPLLTALGFAAAYGAFNLALSGSILPNTFSAKTTYYAGGGADFPKQVFHFLVDGHMAPVAVLAGLGVVSVLFQLFKRQTVKLLIYFLWPLLMFIAYWKNLPYLYQEGRYLMPVLPFVILLAIEGLRSVLKAGRRILPVLDASKVGLGVQVILLALMCMQFGLAAWEMRLTYADYCKYISERQMKTARWLNRHLPENAIVATHDIGAIAFYSGRRVVDMVGLVSPEMIKNIGRLDKLQGFLVSHGVTHLAVLRNWFEVVNQDPIFQTDAQHPEIMEVFELDPAVTHFTPRDVGQMTQAGMYYLSIGKAQQAGPILQQAVKLDPGSARTHLLLGRALIVIGKSDEAERELLTARQLHPTLPDVPMALAEIALRKNQPDEAIVHLEGILQSRSSYAGAYRALAEVYRSYKKDTSKANDYQRVYDHLMTASNE